MRRAGLLTGAVALLLMAFSGVAVAATITGDDRDNSLIGTKRADTIRGLGGDDRLAGRGGDDRLLGRGGNDAIYGGPGSDRISAGRGGDVVHSENDPNVVNVIECGAGRDTVYVDEVNRDQISSDCESVRKR
jgi:Ca2+-binding RTX toxin-like protein